MSPMLKRLLHLFFIYAVILSDSGVRTLALQIEGRTATDASLLGMMQKKGHRGRSRICMCLNFRCVISLPVPLGSNRL